MRPSGAPRHFPAKAGRIFDRTYLAAVARFRSWMNIRTLLTSRAGTYMVTITQLNQVHAHICPFGPISISETDHPFTKQSLCQLSYAGILSEG